MKRKLVVLLLVLSCLGFLANFSFKEAKATPITVTRTFSALASDGQLLNYGSSYSSKHDTMFGYVAADDVYGLVGQEKVIDYYIRRQCEFFDTSVLYGKNLTSATLKLYIEADFSTTDFNMTIQYAIIDAPLTDMDYWYRWFLGDYGSANTTTISGVGYWNIAFSNLSIIDLDGITTLGLRSSRDINSDVPTGDEAIRFYAAEQGSAYAPVLSVTYETEGYHYIVHGPYYENGAVANAFVNLTLQIENMDSNSTYLNGTDGVIDTLDFQVEQRGIAFTWNISALTLNETRMYYLTSATFEEIYIYIPDAGETYNLYLINIFDFAGLSNATVETQINVGGYTRTVERQELDVSNPMPFYLSWAHHYGLKISSDQGSYTWNIAPTSEQTINKVAEKGMFPISIPGLDVTVQAGWMNSTHIQANYTDSESLTTWINVIFRHRITGGTWTDDYSLNQTGNTVQVNWYSADDETDYRVLVQAMRNGTETNSTIFLPHPAATSNPWDNAFTDLFDDLPFPAKNLIGIAIVFFFAGIFSVADRVLGVFVVVIVAGIMTYIGMLDISWTLVGTTAFIVVLAGIEESKRRQHSG